MNIYENVVIVDPKLDEEKLNKFIDRFTKLINKHGKVISVENTGLKRLAYEIQKNTDAYYLIFTFESEPNFIEELQRNYRIDDEVLKFLVIRLESVDHEAIEKRASQPKSEKAKEVKTEEVVEEVKAEVETEETVEETVEEVPVEAETEEEKK